MQARIIDLEATDHLEHAPGIGRFRVATEWRAKGNHRAHDLGQTHRQRPRHRTAQRPADQADGAAIVTGADLLYPLDQALFGVGNRAAVETLFPRLAVITAGTQDKPQSPGTSRAGATENGTAA